MDGDQIAPSEKNQEEEDWNGDHQKQLQHATTAPTEGSDDPSKVPPDSELPETPDLSEIQPKDI